MNYSMEINVTRKFTTEDLVDILSSSIIGGCDYWAHINDETLEYRAASNHLHENAKENDIVCWEDILVHMMENNLPIEVGEYENDDYIIKLPDRLADIVSEGSALHHCVAGYVNRHAIGDTTIMFLRNKQDIDSPWFTIEVNHGDIIQIHGFANKWLSSDDDGYKAVPFVWNWIKKNNFSCNKNILLNMAQGYCAGSRQREWPAECK